MRKFNGKSCEEVLVRWGLLTNQGGLSTPRVQTSRPGKETTTARGWNIPIHPYVVVDIHSKALGVHQALVAYYVNGWKWRKGRKGWGGYWLFRPDKRRSPTAHSARRLLAEVLGIEETKEKDVERIENKD